MVDSARSATLIRSNYVNGSARKNNSEEVARRRVALEQEIEQRQKLARKLQDEKMARAAAQKEERLLKQKEAQQRETLRAKAVLDRRAQVLMEKEKERKEAVLAKAHTVASRLSTQRKTKSAYAFGSSTPRELGYLTQLTREQKVYDRKLTPSERSPTVTSGSSGRLTSTPPNGPRNHTPSRSMTRSLYVRWPELKTHQKSVTNQMTQSVLVTPRTVRISTQDQSSVYRRSMVQRPATVTTQPSRKSETSNTVKKFMQQHNLPWFDCKSQNGQSEYLRKEEFLKPKSMPRRVIKFPEHRNDREMKQGETKMKKFVNNKSDGTSIIFGKNDPSGNDDLKNMEVKNDVEVPENFSAFSKVIEGGNVEDNKTVVEVFKNNVNAENPLLENTNCGTQDGWEIKEESHFKGVALPKHKFDSGETFLFNTKVNNNTVRVATAEIIFAQGEGNQGTQEKGKKNEANFSIEDLKDSTDFVVKSQEDSVVPFSLHPDELDGAALDNEQSKVDSAACTAEIAREELLDLNKEFVEESRTGRESREVAEKIVEVAELREENNFPAAEASGVIIRTEAECASIVQSTSNFKTSETEVILEGCRLAEDKCTQEERRRFQEERLEKEQREREMRRAKLASIMSRTRGGVPPMAVVTPTTQNINISEVVSQDSLKSMDRVSSPVEALSTKSALSHTAASVLQKLATTNPKLLSVIKRNGSNLSLADELSAVDPSMSVTLPSPPDRPLDAHEGSSTVRCLTFEPDVNHRPVAMQ